MIIFISVMIIAKDINNLPEYTSNYKFDSFNHIRIKPKYFINNSNISELLYEIDYEKTKAEELEKFFILHHIFYYKFWTNGQFPSCLKHIEIMDNISVKINPKKVFWIRNSNWVCKNVLRNHNLFIIPLVKNIDSEIETINKYNLQCGLIYNGKEIDLYNFTGIEWKNKSFKYLNKIEYKDEETQTSLSLRHFV